MNVKNIRQRVRATLHADSWTSTVEVGQKLGISRDNALYYLNQLVEAGEAVQDTQIVRHLDSNASSRRYTFRLIEDEIPDPNKAPATPPAYRNLRLSENLTSYDRTNHDFAALCMMVRR
jgi:biotin operon repressor